MVDDAPISVPAETISLGAERPLRMRAVAPALGGEAMIESDPARASAAPVYAVALSFDWRRDEPLAAAHKRERGEA